LTVVTSSEASNKQVEEIEEILGKNDICDFTSNRGSSGIYQ